MTDVGGESPCWAHLVDDLDRDPSPPPTLDLTRQSDAGSGVVRSLPHGGDPDANLVQLAAGDEIGRHVNAEVDVLVVVWDGTGELHVDGHAIALRPGVVVSVPTGSTRGVRAGSEGVRYLSIHRRRDPMTIGRP